MYEDSLVLDSLWSVEDTANFIAYLARQGIPSWDTESQAELENDIAWLLDDNDDSELDNEPYWLFSSNNPHSAIYLALDSDKPQVLLCGGWLSKKWKKTKKFTKKHAKAIIIATAVVVVATAVIIVTNGAATPAVVAGAAAALDDNREPVNKPGEVRFKDEPPPTHEKQGELTPPQTLPQPTPQSTPTSISPKAREAARRLVEKTHIPSIKEILSESLPNELLNIPPEEHSKTTGQSFKDAKDFASYLAHESVDAVSNAFDKETIDVWHLQIDEKYGTSRAEKYEKDPSEREPELLKGKSPFGKGVPALVGQLAAATLKNKAVQEATKNLTSKLLQTSTAVGTAAATSKLLPSTPTYTPQETQIRSTLESQGYQPPPRPENIPQDWKVLPSDKNGGIKYTHNIPRKSGGEYPKEEVRVMPANPDSPFPGHQRPYVTHRIEDRYYDKDGNVVDKETIEAHIDINEYDYEKITLEAKNDFSG